MNSFPRRIKKEPPKPPNIAGLPGAFVNQGHIQNLQVTIKNYNYPSNQPHDEKQEYPEVKQVAEENVERITVIKNIYYE